MAKIACVAVVKNEERHIPEWIAYQYAIGFDTVVLLDNQSTDATIAQALEFAATQDIRIIDWRVATPDYQSRAYEHALGRFRNEFQWIAFFDCDEFLVLDHGLDVKTCLAARADAAAVAVNWAIFGSSGHQAMPEGLVIEHFLQRSEAGFGPNQHVKSIIRPALAQSCINAHVFQMNGPYRDLAGREIDWLQPGVANGAPDYAGGKLHHYFTRSREAWEAKLNRGYHDIQRGSGDFEIYNRNEIFDDSAARFARRVRGIMAGQTFHRPAVNAAQFSRLSNPLGSQGFVLGWERALLGNALSCFANLFALAERTGIPTAYPQILSTGNMFEISDRSFYTHGNLTPGQFSKLDALSGYTDDIFNNGYESYGRRFITLPLQNLHELDTESGIVVFSTYAAKFQDLAGVEESIKSFCNRGNGIILAGAFWHQYLDMRDLHSEGSALKEKLRLIRQDGAGNRANAMQRSSGNTIRVGIHIRCFEDYKIWHGGKYYFEVAQYVRLMRRIHEDLAGTPHHFCVCSDTAIDIMVFNGLPVWYERGGMEDDFVALSKCDYVIGPPSTFGTWSAFLGGAKRVVLTPDRMASPDAWPILETAIDVIYPTGGYLPGDPAAHPI